VLDLVKPIGTATSRSQGRDESGIERLGAGVGFIVWLWISAVIAANFDFWAMLLLSCTTAITGGMHGKEDQV